MGRQGKLKTANPWVILPLAAALAVAVVLVERYDNDIFQGIMLAVMLLASLTHLVILARTGNAVYLVPLSFYMLAGSVALAILRGWRPAIPWLASVAMIMFVFFIAMLASKRIKWYYRDILELAARPVRGTDDGFSSRPFPAGRMECSREEITAFARFLGKKVVVVPFIEEERVVLVIPENVLSFFFIPGRKYDRSTYVSFRFDGSVVVNIAGKDYGRFRDQLTFDQLCDSLGSIFKEMFDRYRNGEADSISRMLDSPLTA